MDLLLYAITRKLIADSLIGAGALKGEKGDNGRDGKDGLNGKDGRDATISIGSVRSGTDAYVSNSGTPINAVLDFIIPKGEKGDKGDKGETGPQGERGYEGPRGATGLQGLTGPKGDTGSKGDTGPKGEKGDRGEQGPQCIQGPQGIQGLSADTITISEIYISKEELEEKILSLSVGSFAAVRSEDEYDHKIFVRTSDSYKFTANLPTYILLRGP